MDTIVIPVNFRGSQIMQTVTDLKTVTTTTTDYSVQTLLNYEKPSDEPFFPLAPALHCAARVVPAEPFLNTLPIYPTAPAAFSTSYVTHTHTAISTISTDITSDITITLGGREIKTEITQPTTQVTPNLSNNCMICKLDFSGCYFNFLKHPSTPCPTQLPAAEPCCQPATAHQSSPQTETLTQLKTKD